MKSPKLSWRLLPRHHRYSKSLDRLICWAGEDDAATVSAADVAGWALRSGAEARADPKARHGVGAQEAMVLATRAAYARAIDAGLVRHNPATGVALPDRPPSRRTHSAPTNSNRPPRPSHPLAGSRTRRPRLRIPPRDGVPTPRSHPTQPGRPGTGDQSSSPD